MSSYFGTNTAASSAAFGVVTVLNVKIYSGPSTATLANWSTNSAKNIYNLITIGTVAGTAPEAPATATPVLATLDHLQVTNLTTNGPTITINGGQNNNVLIKYGKSARCEITDALGQADALVAIGGAEVDTDGNMNITDKFPGPVTIIGDGFVVDQKTGKHVSVHVLMYQFLPDAVTSFSFSAGNAATFDLPGDLLGTQIGSDVTANGCGYSTSTFYSIIPSCVIA